MAIQEFDQNTVFNNPDLPSGALSSKQFNTIVELLGEGEIEGSATASKANITDKTSTAYFNAFKKDIFLNGTQVLQEAASNTAPQDSDFNYKDVGFDFRLGTSSQTFIAGISNIETESVIGTTVTTSTPVTHTVSSSDINAVRVTLRFPSMQKFEDDGDINGVEVNLLIKTIENDGTTTTVIDDTVSGRSTNAYFRDYIVKLKSTTSFPVAIRVERVTADSTDAKLINAFQFNQATNIIFEQNAYANTAHVALRFNAEQFPRIPKRVYRIRGRKVKIPHNATVDLQTGAISYAGTFNGTFKTDKEWTTDPAWILYDLLTDTRAGCGIAEANLDKFTFKSVSEYCGASVDAGNGDGSTEPRFSCNVNITQRQEAYGLINSLCSVMRVMPFYSAGGIAISQDSPKDPSYIFTNANVTEAGFLYAGSSLKTRHTVINVSYFDMTTQEVDVETIEADSATQTKYGIVTKNIKAFATTSRNQARRLGRWFLYNEQNAGETCTFATTAAAGVLVRCGDVIEISDRLKAGVRRGGLLKSVTSTTVVVLDDSTNTDIPSIGDSPTISIILPDGSLEEKTISGISGTTITVSSAFSTAPNQHAPYILETSNLQTTTWRVVNVKENEDRTFSITALSHNSDKYAFVEDGSALPTRTVNTLTVILNKPEGLTVSEKIVEINNKAVSKLILDWQTQAGATKYEVQYKYENGDFKKIETLSSDAEIFNTDAGVYEIRVFSFNALGQPSREPATTIFNAVGKTLPPSDITNLTYEPISDNEIRLRWDAVPDLDVRAGGRIHIRHSPKTDGSGTFQDATDLVFGLSGASTEKNVPLLEGEYILKAQDDGDRFSTGETSIVIDLPESQPKLLIQSRREDQDSPPFQGSKTNIGLDESATPPNISLAGTGNIDDVGVSITGTFDDITFLDDLGGVASTGTYLFNETLDLGAVFTLNLRKILQSDSIYSTDLFDSIQDLNARENFDGTSSVDTNAETFVQFSQDGTSYNSFQKFANGEFKGRTFKFKTVLTTNDTNQDIRVTQLGYFAELKQRTEVGSKTSSGNTQVTYDHTFFTGTSALLGANSNLPSIGITAFDMQSGDFYEITNQTGDGFQIHFKNSSNASVARNFNFTAIGFGKG
jgi:predicted phage tail protein